LLSLFQNNVSVLCNNPELFEEKAIELFQFQYKSNLVYKEYCQHLKVNPVEVSSLQKIPFLPVECFKSHKISTFPEKEPKQIFTSSGTTGSITSKHFVYSPEIYEAAYLSGFELEFGNPKDWCFLALLPSYLEREGSSLIDMAEGLIQKSKYTQSGFYLNNLTALHNQLLENEKQQIPTLLLGVSFALLDFTENFPISLKHTVVMETGGMKGKRREMIREELHSTLTQGFGVKEIASEYGMTELLSQAYSKGNGLFSTPPWMKIMLRDSLNPLDTSEEITAGNINVIDLANIESCAFIQTQDLGKKHGENLFEVQGRSDNSDIRGCNLMVL
jgi:phenylacetate-coenzyme A ligase PaaK-like adenylate-forming protein